MRNIFTTFIAPSLLLGSAMLPVAAWSMDELTDTQLGATTGQDGISLQIVPNSVAGVPTIPIDNIVLSNGAGAAAASLRSDLKTVQFYSAATTTVDSMGNTVNTGVINSGGLTKNVIGVDLDATGGGALSTVTTGANPVLSARFAMPNVRTIGVFLTDPSQTTGTGVAGSLLGIAPRDANTTGALSVGNALISPILSVGTYDYTGSTQATPVSTLAIAPKRLNINLGSDASMTLKLGATGSSAMLALTSLDIKSIDFNGQALNLESQNSGNIACTSATASCASRLSVTPSITGLNLSGATVDLLTQTQMQAMFPGAVVTAGGVVIQGAAVNKLTNIGVVLNDVTAGTSGYTSTFVPPSSSGYTFATGIPNASMGSIGVVDMKITGLKIGVSGM